MSFFYKKKLIWKNFIIIKLIHTQQEMKMTVAQLKFDVYIFQFDNFERNWQLRD